MIASIEQNRPKAALVGVKNRSGQVVWHGISDSRGDLPGMRMHPAAALDGARSLEGLLNRFGGGEIVDDPTGAFERATRLIHGQRAARAKLGARLRGVHLDRNGRTLYARVRHQDDIAAAATVLGECFAAALAGSGLEIGMTITTEPAPTGALALEQRTARHDDITRTLQRASTAMAVVGAALIGVNGGQARAEDKATPARELDGGESLTPVAPSSDAWAPRIYLADGFGEPARTQPRRRAKAAAAPQQAAAPFCPNGEANRTRVVRAIYSASGTLMAAHLDVRDPGGDDQFAQSAVEYVRQTPLSTWDTFEPSPEVDGVRAGRVLRQRGANGDRIFIVHVVDCAGGLGSSAPVEQPVEPAAPTAPATPAIPPPALPAAAPAAATQQRLGYAMVGLDYIDRSLQDGALLVGEGQIAFDEKTALNVQGVAGTIDGAFAGGAQLALQRFIPLASEHKMALGGFVSGVTSTAPNNNDLELLRAGLGAALIRPKLQLVIRGGYARAEGFGDYEGGFARGEAVWFPNPDLGLELFAEEDPVTGAGAGLGVRARPFSDVLARLMIDADMSWHQDGEDSFRVGLRWLFGQAEPLSVREQRLRQGMAPILPIELERLPDDETLAANQAPYCGDAGQCPA